MNHLKVKEFTDEEFITITSNMDISEAVTLLLQKGFTKAVVMDEKKDNQVVGILSAKDCWSKSTLKRNLHTGNL